MHPGGPAGRLPPRRASGQVGTGPVWRRPPRCARRAVVGGPPLVVADEPTAQLDADNAAALLRGVRALVDRGASMVVATHDPLVVAFADRTIYLRHGTLEAEAVRAGAAEALAVIDAGGRIQLPPDLLSLFPSRRARIGVEEGRVWISPP